MAVDIVNKITRMEAVLPDKTARHEVDRHWMQRALELAQEARGYTAPNPLVGAIVLNASGDVVGADYHHRAGQLHAERLALAQAGEAARGGTLYVTLEPCCHFGRTPPCTEAIVTSGVRRVVAAMQDPNPKVAGKGFAALRQAGIEVTVGVGEAEARRLNEPFCKYITTGLPFGLWKIAMSLDGKIAAKTGDSRWISSPESRAEVHELRQAADAIVVGSGTVLKDDPLLTTRRANGKPGRDARPILVDSRGRIPATAKVFTTPRNPDIPPLVVTTSRAPVEIRTAWEQAGAEVWVLPEDKDGHVDLTELGRRLGTLEVTSLLIESGGTLAEAALRAGMIDRVLIYIAPILVGGATAPTALGGIGVERLADAWQLSDLEVSQSGADIRVTGRVRRRVQNVQGMRAGAEGDDGGCSRE